MRRRDPGCRRRYSGGLRGVMEGRDGEHEDEEDEEEEAVFSDNLSRESAWGSSESGKGGRAEGRGDEGVARRATNAFVFRLCPAGIFAPNTLLNGAVFCFVGEYVVAG